MKFRFLYFWAGMTTQSVLLRLYGTINDNFIFYPAAALICIFLIISIHEYHEYEKQKWMVKLGMTKQPPTSV